MLIKQNYRCPCGRGHGEGGKDLEIDHDHGKLLGDPLRNRGLLCHRCNVAIGLLGDRKESIKKLIGRLVDYL